jgi:hypothetical protein
MSIPSTRLYFQTEVFSKAHTSEKDISKLGSLVPLPSIAELEQGNFDSGVFVFWDSLPEYIWNLTTQLSSSLILLVTQDLKPSTNSLIYEI